MPSVDSQHYSLNRPFEWVPTQNANNVENPSTGRRMGVNRDFTAYKKTKWLPFPPAVFAETRRPRSSYGRAYGRRVSAAAAIGKRSCLAHWGPDLSPTGQNSRDTPPLYLVPLAPRRRRRLKIPRAEVDILYSTCASSHASHAPQLEAAQSMRHAIAALLLSTTQARDWRTAAFWPEVLESLERRIVELEEMADGSKF